ncbi:MAG TPA: peptidase S8, partial [Gemmatimonadetes bacterium]|nr:peptidase S8 [Gemmatimonadota bacterium]
ATQVDIFAPGVAIMAAAPDDEYEASDGTSLSAPVVTGIAGLLLAYFPDLDAESVRRLILDTATDARGQMVVRPGDEGGSVLFGELSVTGGVVNAAAAVRRALEDARER